MRWRTRQTSYRFPTVMTEELVSNALAPNASVAAVDGGGAGVRVGS